MISTQAGVHGTFLKTCQCKIFCYGHHTHFCGFYNSRDCKCCSDATFTDGTELEALLLLEMGLENDLLIKIAQKVSPKNIICQRTLMEQTKLSIR